MAGTPALRPCLVTHVFQDTETGDCACEIAYGAKNLKILKRKDKDLIVQNFTDMQEVGIPIATRFDLDGSKRVVLRWDLENFQPWSGFQTPRIGRLTEDYQKEYAWLMMKRMGT